MDHLIAIAIAAWFGTGILCYALFHRVSYNVLDPIMVIAIFIPFSASLLAVLCATDLVPWSKFLLFSGVLVSYLVGARVAGSYFDRGLFRKNLISIGNQFTQAELRALLCAAVAITAILGVIGLLHGAEGDNRQQFGKLFRPLLLVQNGLFLLSLVLLLSQSFPTYRAALWVSLLAALSIPFSGKGVFVPVLYWLGLRYFVSGHRVTLRTITISAAVIIAGVGIMALTAYGESGFTGVFDLLGYRLWMSGDVYIYAYKLGGLSALRGEYHVSFLPYMFHPLIALFGIQTYRLPLGSMLASEAVGKTVLTGPNPQLPVLLDFFFPDSLLTVCIVAFIIGFLVIAIRPLSAKLFQSRARFVRLGGMAAGIMAPSAGFIDNEQVQMYLVAIASTVVVGILIDLLLRASRPSLRTVRAAPTN